MASPGRRGGAKQAGREEVAGARGRARHRAASCAGTGRRQAYPLVVGLHSVGLSRWAWWAAEVSPGKVSLLSAFPISVFLFILFCVVLV